MSKHTIQHHSDAITEESSLTETETVAAICRALENHHVGRVQQVESDGWVGEIHADGLAANHEYVSRELAYGGYSLVTLIDADYPTIAAMGYRPRVIAIRGQEGEREILVEEAAAWALIGEKSWEWLQ